MIMLACAGLLVGYTLAYAGIYKGGRYAGNMNNNGLYPWDALRGA